MRGLVLLALLTGCTRENPDALDRSVSPPPPPGTGDHGRADLGFPPRTDLAVRPGADLSTSSRDLATSPDQGSGFAIGVMCGGTLCASGSGCCTSDGGKTGTCVTDATQCPTTSKLFGCDGPEDCVAGAACCLGLSGDYNCTPSFLCLGSLCHQASECGTNPSCCPVSTGAVFGVCSSAATCN
jgi:hypothetical protein